MKMVTHNVQDVIKAVLRDIFIALHAYIKIERLKSTESWKTYTTCVKAYYRGVIIRTV